MTRTKLNNNKRCVKCKHSHKLTIVANIMCSFAFPSHDLLINYNTGWILMVWSSHLLRQSVYTSAAFVRRIPIHSCWTPIPVVEQTKFLGLIFDKKLSFIPHLQYLKNKCFKALNLLRVVANTKWGSDEKTLLHLYRSLIRSKLEYGAACMVLRASLTSACWTQYKTKPYVHVWVLSGHPQLQAYMLRRMKCLSTWDAECFRQNTLWE